MTVDANNDPVSIEAANVGIKQIEDFFAAKPLALQCARDIGLHGVADIVILTAAAGVKLAKGNDDKALDNIAKGTHNINLIAKYAVQYLLYQLFLKDPSAFKYQLTDQALVEADAINRAAQKKESGGAP